MLKGPNFLNELKAKWISCGGILFSDKDGKNNTSSNGDDNVDDNGDDDLDFNSDDESVTFVITKELSDRTIKLEPCLVAAGFSTFSCNDFSKSGNENAQTLTKSTLFKSCPDCKAYGNLYGFCESEYCKQFKSNPLNITSGGDWSLNISKIVGVDDVIDVVMDYIIFNYSFKYTESPINDFDDFFSYCKEKYRYINDLHFSRFQGAFSVKKYACYNLDSDNSDPLNWGAMLNTLNNSGVCCSFNVKGLKTEYFGGTDDKILRVLNLCGDGNGDCLFVQQNSVVFILDYETS